MSWGGCTASIASYADQSSNGGGFWVIRSAVGTATLLPAGRFGSQMCCGLIPFWAKDASVCYEMIDEMVAAKPSVREAFLVEPRLTGPRDSPRQIWNLAFNSASCAVPNPSGITCSYTFPLSIPFRTLPQVFLPEPFTPPRQSSPPVPACPSAY